VVRQAHHDRIKLYFFLNPLFLILNPLNTLFNFYLIIYNRILTAGDEFFLKSKRLHDIFTRRILEASHLIRFWNSLGINFIQLLDEADDVAELASEFLHLSLHEIDSGEFRDVGNLLFGKFHNPGSLAKKENLKNSHLSMRIELMQFATIYNLRKTTRLFFFVVTLTYLTAYLLAANNIDSSFNSLLANYLDLPAIFTGILLITSGILQKVDLEETGHRFATLAIWILAFGFLAAFILLDFLGAA
jgi:hypothetical protein